MVKDDSAREETRCRHIGYSYRLAARVILYASSHIPRSLLHQSWSTGWNENSFKEIMQKKRKTKRKQKEKRKKDRKVKATKSTMSLCII